MQNTNVLITLGKFVGIPVKLPACKKALTDFCINFSITTAFIHSSNTVELSSSEKFVFCYSNLQAMQKSNHDISMYVLRKITVIENYTILQKNE